MQFHIKIMNQMKNLMRTTYITSKLFQVMILTQVMRRKIEISQNMIILNCLLMVNKVLKQHKQYGKTSVSLYNNIKSCSNKLPNRRSSHHLSPNLTMLHNTDQRQLMQLYHFFKIQILLLRSQGAKQYNKCRVNISTINSLI